MSAVNPLGYRLKCEGCPAGIPAYVYTLRMAFAAASEHARELGHAVNFRTYHEPVHVARVEPMPGVRRP